MLARQEMLHAARYESVDSNSKCQILWSSSMTCRSLQFCAISTRHDNLECSLSAREARKVPIPGPPPLTVVGGGGCTAEE
jgi:hypothetical protein